MRGETNNRLYPLPFTLYPLPFTLMSRKIKKKQTTLKKRQLFDVNAKTQEALSLHRTGHLDQASEIYLKILAVKPLHGDALNLLGSLFLQKQDYQRAIPLLRKAVKIYPDRPNYLSNLASAFKDNQQLDAAEAAYKKVIAIHPDHIEALYNLAGVLVKKQKLNEAANVYKEVLELKPTMLEALNELGALLISQEKFTEAINCFEKTLSHAPNNIEAYCAIGAALQTQEKFAESIKVYEKALKKMPTEGIFFNNMANSLVKLGRLHEALIAYQKALEYNPNLRNAYINLAWTYREHGQLKESFDCFQRLQARKDLSPQDHSDLLFSLNYDPSFSNKELLDAANKWWKIHGHPETRTFSHPPRALPPKKLKVGFISPDFSKHPVGFFLTPLLQEINEQTFEIFCYAQMNANQGDELTEYIRNRADHWHLISSMSDEAVAEKIFSDRIDILIDLAGHTANNRLMVFVRKPAPIQVNWLGYVNTTGLANMDYRITDQVVDPIGEETAASETIYRLPHGFFCYAPDNSPDYEASLPFAKNGFITFGSFNNLPKITPQVISLWAKIMALLPSAKLLFTSRQFKDKAIISRYKDLFIKEGIGPERINFHGSLPLREYLSLISTVDIALDPFPHNGHTITCDTLWMGVPVITLRGDRYAGRMTASALSTIGLSDLIAEDQEEYVRKCVDLALDIGKLSLMRQGMRKRISRSPMCDKKRFANDFERALWDIWGKTF